MESTKQKKFTDSALFKVIICLALGFIIYLIPTPEALRDDPRAWRLLSIFVATVAALILAPLPMGAVAIIAITTVAVTRTTTVGVALSGFSDATIWLIVSAFLISRGFIKTGLGERIAYMFMAKMGKKTLGLAYSLVFADLVIAPTMPSNTARAGGIFFPIIRSLNDAYGSKVEDGSQRKIASFLTYTIFQTDSVVCSMFMTAMGASVLAVSIAGGLGVEITWMGWFIAALVPGIIGVLLIPLVLYKLYPPGIKETPEAVEIAKKRLQEIGPVKVEEIKMICVFFVLLLLWIFGPNLFAIGATLTALIGLSLMLISGVLTIEDIKSEKGAWDTLIWFSALVMMAGQLNALGIIGWFTNSVAGGVEGINWMLAFVIIAIAYYYSHYFFASATAHVAAMYGAFLALAIAVGTPPMLAALVLVFFTNLHMGITHYGTGPAPVYYGPGYVKLGEWWGLAFFPLSFIHLIIWFGVGGLWWRILGHW